MAINLNLSWYEEVKKSEFNESIFLLGLFSLRLIKPFKRSVGIGMVAVFWNCAKSVVLKIFKIA